MHHYQPSGNKGPSYLSLSFLYGAISFVLGFGWAGLIFGLSQIVSPISRYESPVVQVLLWIFALVLCFTLPIFCAWLLNNFHVSFIRRGHCRSPRLAGWISLVALVSFGGSFQVLNFVSQRWLHWISGMDLLFFDPPPLSVIFWIGGALEFLLVARTLIRWAGDHTSRPYCENCLKWFAFVQFVRYPAKAQREIEENLADLQWKNNPSPQQDGPLEIQMARCPQCGQESEVYMVLCLRDGPEEEDFDEMAPRAMMTKDEYDQWRDDLPTRSLQFFSTTFAPKKKPFPTG